MSHHAPTKANGDWRGSNQADVYFSDEEVWLLSEIDAESFPGQIRMSLNIAEQEMRCQRDMRVRGKRLWHYHERLGDLWDILGLSAMHDVLGPTSVTLDIEVHVS